ncbi:MAG TPA: amidohydrolase family protein [Jatrophihabitans sp.]|nr:amidohydrolase family protein [Jatrophihabitans sp.]
MPDGALTDAEVVGVWRRLGLPGLADIHVHFLPPAMLAKVWRYFDDAERHYGLAWPIHYRTSEAGRLATLAAIGVRHFPTLCYPHKPGMAGWLNGWCADFAAAHPQAVHSATFFGEPSAATDVRTALAAGARVFKVHVQVGGFDPSDPLLDEAWGLLAEAGVPVVVHCGSGPIPGAHTGPGPIGLVLRRHPALTAVIAHAGAPEYAEHLALAVRYRNVYLDTTMVGTGFLNRLAPIPADTLRAYRDLGHKIMLGSDFPNIPYCYAHQIQSLIDWGFGDDWLRAVLWHNGAALMGFG